jgi:hypothetical protein
MHLQDLQVLLDAPVGSDMLPLPAKAKLEIAPPRNAEAPGRSDDLCFASAAEIAARVRSRELSPFEVARAFVERADAHRSLHAFITLRPETVLREARQLEVRIQSGEDIGPLAGVPVAVKDLMPVTGYPMTCGTKAIEAQEQHRDAEVVARLRAAGALVMGTTNLHELAYGVTSANVHFGPVGNPVARPTASPADRAEARRRRSRPGLPRSAWAPTPAAPSAFPLPAAASSASRAATTPSPARACGRSPSRSITLGRLRAASPTPRSASRSWPGCRPAAPARNRSIVRA